MSIERWEFALKAAVACVAMFGVIQYFWDQSIDRKRASQEMALEYLERYGEGQMLAARRELFVFWNEHSEYINILRSTGSSDRSYRIFISLSLEGYQRAADLQASLFQLSNFYEQIWHCRSEELCDAKILDSFFCRKAKIQSQVYGPFFEILGRDSGFDDLGGAVDRFGSQC